MVRRVRLGRRHDRGRPLPTKVRWTGPPPLLMVATVVALAVTPFLDDDPAPPAQVTTAAETTTSTYSSEPQAEPEAQSRAEPPADPHAGHPSQPPASNRGGLAVHKRKSAKPAPAEIGVASMNMLHDLAPAQAGVDARRLVRNPRIDIVGWQEAEPFHPLLHSLAGWGTRTFPWSDGSSELAVSWRRSKFRLVDSHQRAAIGGVSARQGAYPFGDRSVAVVTLEHRRTGKRMVIIDAHLPPAIEDLHRPGRWRPTLNAQRGRTQLRGIARVWREAKARWVLATGDFNFDAGADLRHRIPGGPSRTLGPIALSSYQALGVRSLVPTYPSNGRHIDYVWVDREAHRLGRVEFLGQTVIRGLNSDHNALLVRLAIS